MTKEKVIIITGGSSGIGASCGDYFCQKGNKVVIYDKKNPSDELLNLPGILYIEGSVTNEERLKQAADMVLSMYGRIDVLINSAGINEQLVQISGQSTDEWSRVMDINLKGTYISCKIIGPLIAESGGGAILNIASISGIVAAPYATSYSPSKAGVIMLTKVLALELASKGIRVNCIAPGYIETALLESLLKQAAMSRETLIRRTPLGRFGKPKEVAACIAFLVSEDAAFITGEVLTVDGGLVAFRQV